ncbi:hypothetical protein [Elioraea sp.]|uniref:hypothetical protein n=1 Tax=Elioraea sp. TaxID=2185103 RepID=UPI003F71BEB5
MAATRPGGAGQTDDAGLVGPPRGIDPHAQAQTTVMERFEATATLPGKRYLDEAQDFVRSEVAAWAPLVIESGATPEG